MLRFLRRTCSSLPPEIWTSPQAVVLGAAAGTLPPLLISSPTFQTNGNPNVRFYSSVMTTKSGSLSWIRSRASPSWNPEQGGLLSPTSPCWTPVIYEQQKRGFWKKEGRIGWRRMRAKGMRQREKLLNPSSPVINQRVPWPKDDMESLPEDLFPEDIEEFGPEETRTRQNVILNTINNQIGGKSEGRLFAVVHVNGKQFKVTPEDIIIVQEYFPPTVGDQIRLHKVLLVGGKDFTLLGCPMLDSELVRVEATVIEKTLSYTKLHFKMIKRKNYRRLKFIKTPYTMLRINLIELLQPLDMITSELDSTDASSSHHHHSINA